MTLIDLVSEHLQQMFIQIAEDITEANPDLTDDEVAEISFALFSVERTLRHAFWRWAESDVRFVVDETSES